MNIIFMGTTEFAVPSIQALVKAGHEISLVFTANNSSPVAKAAEILTLPVCLPKDHEIIQHFSPDIIVVAAYGKILSRTILDIPELGCLNIHPSLLPKYRGASPIQAAILAGDSYTGVTIMLMSEKLDAGSIIAQQQIAILDSDTAGTLMESLALVAADEIVRIIPLWTNITKITDVEQNHREATYTHIIKNKDAKINWSDTTININRTIRAYNPNPIAYTYFKGKILKIFSASPVSDSKVDMTPGTVFRPNQISIAVVTGQGILKLNEVQLEGKKRLTINDFARGQKDFIGSIFD